MNFIEFWNKLVFQPKKFFTEDFNDESSPFLFITIAIYGMSNIIDRIEKQFSKADFNGNLHEYEWMNSWLEYWLGVVIFGALSGYFFYYLGGWFYNVRIKWSDGTSDIKKAKFLFLYPEFVPSLIHFLTVVFFMMQSPVPYDPNADLKLIELVGLALLIIAVFYSVYISYIGVTSTTDVSINKARLWFLTLPIIFYTLVYSSMIVFVFYSYYS